MSDGSVGLFFVLVVLSYFLPGIVAKARNHHNANAILLLNLLAGWTGVVWLACLIWAVTAVRQPDPQVAAVHEGRVPCPNCAELILPAAKVCKHCGLAVASPALAAPMRPADEWRG